MLKKTFTYTDFFGKERTEDCYFHLSESKLAEMDLKTQDGWSEWVKEIVAAKDNETLVETFKKVILASYGQKSPDGRRFIQTKELSEEFSQTPMFDQLFMSLVTDANAAADFFNGIVPEKVQKEAKKQELEQKENSDNVVSMQ